MSLAIVQSAALQRPTGAHGPKTFIEADSGRELKITRDAELGRGQAVDAGARVLSRRRIARSDATHQSVHPRSVRSTEEDDFAQLGWLAALLMEHEEEQLVLD